MGWGGLGLVVVVVVGVVVGLVVVVVAVVVLVVIWFWELPRGSPLDLAKKCHKRSFFSKEPHKELSSSPLVVWGGFGLVVVVVLLALASRSSSSSSSGSSTSTRGREGRGGIPWGGLGTRDTEAYILYIYIYICYRTAGTPPPPNGHGPPPPVWWYGGCQSLMLYKGCMNKYKAYLSVCRNKKG